MTLIAAHGGALKENMVSGKEREYYLETSNKLLSHNLTQRQLYDLELILNGGFSPLQGFMLRADYENVLENMRLCNNLLWSIPITLDVPKSFANQIKSNNQIVLRDSEGIAVAILSVTDIWTADKKKEAIAVFGTDDTSHPGVSYLFYHAHDIYLGGHVIGLNMPTYYDFNHLRHTPKELRAHFEKLQWKKIAGFQTRNPMHRAHQEITLRAAREHDANLLIHPTVGMTKPGDVDHYTRVRCYELLLNYYPKHSTLLSLLPLAMRMAGPREALWHSIIRKNYGCTKFIVGRDHAGPGRNKKGELFYAPYAAQELVSQHQEELNIKMIPFQEMVYVSNKKTYMPLNQIGSDETVHNISGTEFRSYLREGKAIPDWFSFPEIIQELRKTYPPKYQQGFTLFFTGLSGSGKSTLANGLLIKLLQLGGRSVTLLDGDLIRKHLCSDLGFSKEDRDINISRIGYVASEITKHRGIAICAQIAPYQDVREEIKNRITEYGGFFEIYVATPLTICEQRDRKGLYAKARAGVIKNFTGINDPYEKPHNPDIIIDTSCCTPNEAVEQILTVIKNAGYLS